MFLLKLLLVYDASFDYEYHIVDVQRIPNEVKTNWSNLGIGIIELLLVVLITYISDEFKYELISAIIVIDAIFALLTVKVYVMIYYFKANSIVLGTDLHTRLVERSSWLNTYPVLNYVPFVFGVLYMIFAPML